MLTIILSLVAAGFVALYLMAEYQHMRAQTELRYQRWRIRATEAALDEAETVLGSVRSVLEHCAGRVEPRPELGALVRVLASTLPAYVKAMPEALQRAAVGTAWPAEMARCLPQKMPEIDELVQRIDDPVLHMLWRLGTPSALAEMLRHAVFLSADYPPPVYGASTQDAVVSKVTRVLHQLTIAEPDTSAPAARQPRVPVADTVH